MRLTHLNKIVEKSYQDYYNFLIDNNIEDNLSKKDCRRILLNFLIIGICNDIKSSTLNYKNLLFYQEIDNNQKIDSIVKRLLKSIPLYSIVSNIDIDTFLSNIEIRDSDTISGYSKSINTSKVSLSKFKQFIKRNELTYLSDSYFNIITNKMIVLR